MPWTYQDGATNIMIERRRTPTRRATMLRVAQIYGERFADADGRIRATFDLVWLSGWAPHESQQCRCRGFGENEPQGGGEAGRSSGGFSPERKPDRFFL